MAHEGVFRPDATRVHVYTWEREGFSVPMMCQHCRDAPCITVCTPHALTRDPDTGWVDLDQAKCRSRPAGIDLNQRISTEIAGMRRRLNA
jgi:Fe-S-cluster-containing hydrogenase component 2